MATFLSKESHVRSDLLFFIFQTLQFSFSFACQLFKLLYFIFHIFVLIISSDTRLNWLLKFFLYSQFYLCSILIKSKLFTKTSNVSWSSLSKFTVASCCSTRAAFNFASSASILVRLSNTIPAVFVCDSTMTWYKFSLITHWTVEWNRNCKLNGNDFERLKTFRTSHWNLFDWIDTYDDDFHLVWLQPIHEFGEAHAPRLRHSVVLVHAVNNKNHFIYVIFSNFWQFDNNNFSRSSPFLKLVIEICSVFSYANLIYNCREKYNRIIFQFLIWNKTRNWIHSQLHAILQARASFCRNYCPWLLSMQFKIRKIE